MRKPRARNSITRLTAFVAVITAASSAFAQGCAMCYNTAAAAKAGAIQALRSGILVLLIPPVLIFGAVCVFALKNQNRCNDDDEAADDSPPFLVDGFPEYRLARDVPSAEAR